MVQYDSITNICQVTVPNEVSFEDSRTFRVVFGNHKQASDLYLSSSSTPMTEYEHLQREQTSNTISTNKPFLHRHLYNDTNKMDVILRISSVWTTKERTAHDKSVLKLHTQIKDCYYPCLMFLTLKCLVVVVVIVIVIIVIVDCLRCQGGERVNKTTSCGSLHFSTFLLGPTHL